MLKTKNGRRRSAPPAPGRIMVIDVGGSHVKFRIGPGGAVTKFESGPEMDAAGMARSIKQLAPRNTYDAVSIGYPGVVVHNRIAADPYNLGPGWVHFDFERALGAPVRLINDATMQAIGSYAGGRMLFLGLGTGMGATLILDGMVEPMELGHMPLRHGHSYEDYVGERGRLKLGTKKWRKLVREVVEQFSRIFEVDYVVLGGGNLKRLKTLPRNARPGDNTNAFRGGLRLWESDDRPLRVTAVRATKPLAARSTTKSRTTRSTTKADIKRNPSKKSDPRKVGRRRASPKAG